VKHGTHHVSLKAMEVTLADRLPLLSCQSPWKV